jgi:hypothetical protein
MAASVQDMGIDHGRADILVPKEFLDGADVIACFKQMRGKRMSEGVTTDMLNYACTADCFLDAPLKNRLMSVMPPLFAGLGVLPAVLLRKYPLPSPFLWSVGHRYTAPSNRLNMLPTLRAASIYPSTTLTYLVSI